MTAALPLYDRIAGDLAQAGWSALPGFFTGDMVAALDSDLRIRESAQPFHQALTGRSATASAAPIRTDRTLWLDGSTPAQRAYLEIMESLRLALNRALFLGLFDYECHYALYPAGGFYQKHVDSLRGARNRVVSCVTYLTPAWREEDAGHLVLYHPEQKDEEMARILPQAGTLAIFMSEDVPHEVRPPARERASIAGWFRCNGSGNGRIDPAR